LEKPLPLGIANRQECGANDSNPPYFPQGGLPGAPRRFGMMRKIATAGMVGSRSIAITM
jgi:hypothetical protein